jgi:hypothetical protein
MSPPTVTTGGFCTASVLPLEGETLSHGTVETTPLIGAGGTAFAVQATTPVPMFNTANVCGGITPPCATAVKNRPRWDNRMA